MAKFYQLPLQSQLIRLRLLLIVCFAGGTWGCATLFQNGYIRAAILTGIIAAQAVFGSSVMIKDIKRDLREQQREASLRR